MKRNIMQLRRIDFDRRITMESDPEFLFLLQNGLLLALKEQGRLNEMEYRRAEEDLMRQRQERAGKKPHCR